MLMQKDGFLGRKILVIFAKMLRGFKVVHLLNLIALNVLEISNNKLNQI
jgi:hypothetical protein